MKCQECLTKEPMTDQFNVFLHPDLLPITEGEGELSGVEIAIKDNILVKNWPATASSKILEGFISPYDATVITKLKKAGATLIGKTNLDEFAMGSSTENSAFGPTKNPWNPEYVPGGSSGGSAAAVAAGYAAASLGTDTGGSIRQPASFCGLTGLKPTYGSVSRYGLIALASSLDVIGPMAYDAETVERIYQVIAGKDSNDQTTFDYTYKAKNAKISELKIGLPKELWDLEIDPEVKKATTELMNFLKDEGAKFVDISLPSIEFALPAYYIILPAEASSNLSRYDGIRFRQSVKKEGQSLIDRYFETRALFGSEVKRRILLGTFVLSVGHYDSYYQAAMNVKAMAEKDHRQAFEKVDLLLSPTTPTLPFKFGARKDPVEMYKSDLMTVAANLAGVPGISLPCGLSKSGLPIGAQLIAGHNKEDLLLSVAKQFQLKTSYHKERPKL